MKLTVDNFISQTKCGAKDLFHRKPTAQSGGKVVINPWVIKVHTFEMTLTCKFQECSLLNVR